MVFWLTFISIAFFLAMNGWWWLVRYTIELLGSTFKIVGRIMWYEIHFRRFRQMNESVRNLWSTKCLGNNGVQKTIIVLFQNANKGKWLIRGTLLLIEFNQKLILFQKTFISRLISVYNADFSMGIDLNVPPWIHPKSFNILVILIRFSKINRRHLHC